MKNLKHVLPHLICPVETAPNSNRLGLTLLLRPMILLGIGSYLQSFVRFISFESNN